MVQRLGLRVQGAKITGSRAAPARDEMHEAGLAATGVAHHRHAHLPHALRHQRQHVRVRGRMKGLELQGSGLRV